MHPDASGGGRTSRRVHDDRHILRERFHDLPEQVEQPEVEDGGRPRRPGWARGCLGPRRRRLDDGRRVAAVVALFHGGGYGAGERGQETEEGEGDGESKVHGR